MGFRKLDFNAAARIQAVTSHTADDVNAGC
jgi:hypothetical protein